MVSVFTPIYNRAHTIRRLFDSLKNQKDNRFEWIIVDDGSEDNTSQVLKGIISEEADFSIVVKHISNHGKHYAINIGVDIASYEAFFIVDSDDYLSHDAIEFVNEKFSDIESDYTFAGISGLRIGSDIKNDLIFNEYVDADNLERDKYGLLGDKAEIYKRSVLKKYPFPYFEGENFMTEEVVWNRIAYDGYKVRWFNKGIYYCEYLSDGLTAKGNDVFLKNPKGWGLWIKESKKYGLWSEERIYNDELYYIEHNIERFSREELCSILNISGKTLDSYMDLINCNKAVLTGLFKQYHKVALYGYGLVGERINNYFNLIGVEPQYIIDRDKTKKCKNLYSTEDNFPDTDLILISILDTPKGVEEWLKTKKPLAHVISIKDLGLILHKEFV